MVLVVTQQVCVAGDSSNLMIDCKKRTQKRNEPGTPIAG